MIGGQQGEILFVTLPHSCRRGSIDVTPGGCGRQEPLVLNQSHLG